VSDLVEQPVRAEIGVVRAADTCFSLGYQELLNVFLQPGVHWSYVKSTERG